ncbi:glycosyltransferase family 2 protein [Rhodobacter sp. CZR27]|uniref:glycosyltransferase n=1 Tax=Rhodobacter sp. CZR27 TaxID=2033869 RepID=UPI0012FE3C4D|nr:glycosyltransferase family 2 protein [Rhodobacter sp. CZR27]
MTVSVCIPAYRAGAFIAETVASVLDQSRADLRLIVAVDPAEDDPSDTTLAALEPFRADPRVDIGVNARRLGWAGNIAALLQRVRTDWYAVLPHDDLWHRDYLAKLLPPLVAAPDAVVSYADMTRFGAATGGRSVVLPPGEDRARHLLRFLLQGAEAMPWRGVTRRSSLAATGGFPTDAHRGFAVECEYALALLGAGRVLHRAEVLYRKRVHAPGVPSASRARVAGVPPAERLAAWRAHDRQMGLRLQAAMRGIAMPSDREALCRAALDAAMLRRRQQMVAPALDAEALVRVGAALAAAAGDGADAGAVRARLHRVLSLHHRAVGEAEEAGREAALAASLDPGLAD